MVRANRADMKTQTRRPINRVAKRGPVTEFGETTTKGYDFHFRDRQMRWHDVGESWLLDRCPYGPVGRLLYVRETHLVVGGVDAENPRVIYRADGEDQWVSAKWTPSIYMPRRFSRDWLRITDVRVERVASISVDDAYAEGLYREWDGRKWWYGLSTEADALSPDPRAAFRELWRSIHGADADLSKYVWAITYERTEAP
jgi:hypothetical protein